MPEGGWSHKRALEEVARHDVGALCWDEPLSRHTTWRIGGPADLLVEPESVLQVQRLMRVVAACGVPLVVLGQGSNILFPDSGIRGVVLKISRRMSRVTVEGGRLVCQAGVWLPHLARRAGEAGIGGIEHVVGIPGTLGGLVTMNGGSQRRYIGSSVRRVWGVDPRGEEICLSNDECRFAYRSSALQHSGLAVVQVELEGPRTEAAASRREMLETLRSRRLKFPLKQPNCGSVFLCDETLYSSLGAPGKLIQEAGLKGLRVGGAQVSHKHANFIVNLGGATASDVVQVINAVRGAVRARYGVQLNCEVRYLDERGEPNHGAFT